MSSRVDAFLGATGPLSLSPAPSPTSSTSSTSSLDALLAAEDPNPLLPPPQMTAHRVIFGRNVIQVPLKQSQTHEYVNLVLSQLEFDAMAVHVPQYEEFPPEEILERITQLLKEQEGKKRQRLGSSSSITSTDQTDSIAAFQGRLLELEYERKRLHTKLKGAKALQINLTEENTALRVQLEQAEQQAIDIEELFQENELLRYQTLHLGSDVAKWKNVAMKTVQELRTLKQELIALKDQVKNDRDEIALTVEDAMAMIVEDVSRREQVLQQSYLAEKREREVMAEKYYELSGRIRVFCRLRPAKEIEDEAKTPALVMPRLNNLLVASSGKEFAFDQTGSGKTHTMVGNERGPLEHRANGLTVHTNAGMIPRALQQVFAIVKKRQMTYVDSLRVSMVEIYNDQILDLLHEGSTGGGKNAVAKSETDITAREVQMGAVKPSVESGALFKLQEENRAFEAKTQAMETQLNALQRQCEQQGDELHEAHSSKEALERQLWLLGGRQRGGKASDELEQDEFSPEARSPSPSRPPSPTPSAKSSRSVSSTTSARSARSMRSVRSAQSTTASSQRPTARRSQVSSSSRLSGTPRTSSTSGPATSPMSRLRRPESMVEREERRKSLSAASRDRVVDPDLRRKSLSATSASRIANQDNRRNSLSTLQTRLMSGLATPRSLRTKEASSPESRVPLHPPARTRSAGSPAPARQGVSASRLSRARSAKALGSSTPPASSPSSNSSTDSKPARTLHRAASTPSRAPSRTPTRTSTRAPAATSKTDSDSRRSSLNNTRSSPSSTPGTSARRPLAKSQSGFGWK
ncbi:hypothetical protein PC117_g9484 [Phytophthora cactorum]|uniref:Kinesin motor domain-containing protein n=1 Tax=Phytophthora cactorum TaxID=29920 RepID=A0A8T1DPJ9_9STRA|nr:hypothetical protein PC117_g9484 [Phytophthora cactorum]